MQQSEAQGWHKNQGWHKVLRQENFAVWLMNIVMGWFFFFFNQSWSGVDVLPSLCGCFIQERVCSAGGPAWLEIHFPVITAQSQPSHTALMSLRTDRLECCASCCFGGPALCRDFSIERESEAPCEPPHSVFHFFVGTWDSSQCHNISASQIPHTSPSLSSVSSWEGFSFQYVFCVGFCYLHKLLSERPIWAWRSGALLSIKTSVLSQLLLPDGTAVHNNKHN